MKAPSSKKKHRAALSENCAYFKNRQNIQCAFGSFGADVDGRFTRRVYLS